MKKFNVSIRENINDCWDSDCVQDFIEADTKEDAIDFAKDYINENGGNAESYMYMAVEKH